MGGQGFNGLGDNCIQWPISESMTIWFTIFGIIFTNPEVSGFSNEDFSAVGVRGSGIYTFFEGYVGGFHLDLAFISWSNILWRHFLQVASWLGWVFFISRRQVVLVIFFCWIEQNISFLVFIGIRVADWFMVVKPYFGGQLLQRCPYSSVW